jgi:predicted lipoprotein
MKKILLVLSIVTGLLIYSCSSEEGGSSDDSYGRSALLTNWADNIIVPAFQSYQSKVGLLNTASNTFVTTPNEANLNALRSAWFDAYKSYQYVGIFNIGMAETLYFRESSDTYPADIAGVESNIATGNYDLAAISQYSKQGFPAIDYLINGLANTDAEIIAFFTGANAQKYKQYLSALTNRLHDVSNAIVTDWTSGYRDAFVANKGNSVSSSVNKVTNNFVKYFEKDIRAAKVGIPAGVFSAGVTYPDKVEAFYKSDVSKELLLAAVHGAHDFYNGKHFNGSATGESLKSYLDFVSAVRDGQNLSAVINIQFDSITTTLNLLDQNFTQQINTDNSKMIAAYDALQQNVVYLKLDMMQA